MEVTQKTFCARFRVALLCLIHEASHVQSPRHKEWDKSLLTVDHFSASAVWTKTFLEGTTSLPGNSGGDSSFLVFLNRPGNCDTMAHQMIQGCLNSPGTSSQTATSLT